MSNVQIEAIIIIIIDNFCIALFSGVHKITALYNILQHFLSENKMEGKMFTKNYEQCACMRSSTKGNSKSSPLTLWNAIANVQLHVPQP